MRPRYSWLQVRIPSPSNADSMGIVNDTDGLPLSHGYFNYPGLGCRVQIKGPGPHKITLE